LLKIRIFLYKKTGVDKYIIYNKLQYSTKKKIVNFDFMVTLILKLNTVYDYVRSLEVSSDRNEHTC